MSGALYRMYLNVQVFIEEYRKFIHKNEFLDRKSFKKIIQLEDSIKTTCRNPKNGRIIHIFLMKTNSRHIKSTQNFQKLMDSLGSNIVDVYIITKEPLSVYINKKIQQMKNLNIYNFLHKYFAINVTKGPLCSKHTILSDEESKKLCFSELLIHPLALPSIFESDPICIWLGAEVGNIIKIDANSEISGQAVRYRIVSAKGNTVGSKVKTKKVEVKKDENDNGKKTKKLISKNKNGNEYDKEENDIKYENDDNGLSDEEIVHEEIPDEFDLDEEFDDDEASESEAE